jgi:hypothetical protein
MGREDFFGGGHKSLPFWRLLSDKPAHFDHSSDIPS